MTSRQLPPTALLVRRRRRRRYVRRCRLCRLVTRRVAVSRLGQRESSPFILLALVAIGSRRSRRHRPSQVETSPSPLGPSCAERRRNFLSNWFRLPRSCPVVALLFLY